MDWIVENKELAAGAVVILIAILWDKMAAFAASTMQKLKSVRWKREKQNIDLEIEDAKAIEHLRERASSFKDKQLLLDIKAIHAKFADHHFAVRDSNKPDSNSPVNS